MSLGKGVYMPPPDSTKYEVERYESMTDEQKIDYQLYAMRKSQSGSNYTPSPYRSDDSVLSFMGGMVIGGMLF